MRLVCASSALQQAIIETAAAGEENTINLDYSQKSTVTQAGLVLYLISERCYILPRYLPDKGGRLLSGRLVALMKGLVWGGGRKDNQRTPFQIEGVFVIRPKLVN